MIRPLFAMTLAACCAAQTVNQPVRAPHDPGIVTTRQAITPAGVPSVFQGRVYGVAWAGTTGDLWVLHASEVYRLDWRANRVVAHYAHKGTPGNQAIVADPGSEDAIVGNSTRVKTSDPQLTGLIRAQGAGLRPMAQGLGKFLPGGLSVSTEPDASGKRYAAAPLVYENKVAIVDLSDGALVKQIDTGIAPFSAAIDRKATTVWVSNLGGRPPKPDELVASPRQKPAEQVVVDSRGIASTGSVTRIDLKTGTAVGTIAVGLHPTALALDEARGRLYVANGNSDSVSVIDTARGTVVRTIAVQPFSQAVRGIAPTALAVSADGATLYTACGGINAVAVIDTASGKARGMIPTGWYPTGLALDPTGKRLAISSLLGAGSGWRESPGKRYVHANRGSVAVVELPDAAQLAAYTTAVAENNRLRLAGSPEAARETARSARPTVVPARSGEPSKIEHVVFVIKENRTYDQVLGDLPKGNGDPSLVMFGADVTPNQHRLAEQFVVLDNFYATGGNSADGHQWITQANETEYCLWPGYQGRSYPYDGSDPMAYSSGGFLWNYAQARGRSVRVYGEFSGTSAAGKPRRDLLKKWEGGGDFTSDWTVKAPIASLNPLLAANYPAYSTAIPDVARAQIFLADLKKLEAKGEFPNLVLLQLPSNHTAGTTAGGSTPKAMVADNDYALGQIVEGLSKSRFWPKMAIFVVEDDAQNGVDHVDGHRTTAFVASPYARRGHVDSTFYSHQSILKTIELMLGLPTMSLFDLIANDMRASFGEEADVTPFTAVRPKQDLFELNPPATALAGAARKAALDSARMKFDVPDAAPTERLNRIVWGAIKGWNTPYPAVKQSVFSPLSLDVEDEDREKR